MKAANKFRRNQLILGLIFAAIGIWGAWGIVEIAYSSYDYPIISADPEYDEVFDKYHNLFKPKKPIKYQGPEWNYLFRFLYNPYKKTINC